MVGPPAHCRCICRVAGRPTIWECLYANLTRKLDSGGSLNLGQSAGGADGIGLSSNRPLRKSKDYWTLSKRIRLNWTGSLAMAMVHLPKYVRIKRLASGVPAYFYEVPSKYRRDPTCPLHSEPLGQDLAQAIARADELNATLDAWRKREPCGRAIGTVDWLFQRFESSTKFKQLAPRSQRSYE